MKKLTAVICIVLSLFLIVGIISTRYIRSERKTENENFIYAAKNIAYEIGKYLETGEEEYFRRAAADITQMNSIAGTAENTVSEENAETLEKLSSVLEYNPEKLISEAERLKEAFKMIGENGENTDYAYAQIQVALSNSGL